MKLLFYTAASNSAAWLDALSRAMPGASIDTWPEGATGATDYALVWKPPVELLRSLGRIKAIFNLGAGVDSVPEPSALALAIGAAVTVSLTGRKGRSNEKCKIKN